MTVNQYKNSFLPLCDIKPHKHVINAHNIQK